MAKELDLGEHLSTYLTWLQSLAEKRFSELDGRGVDTQMARERFKEISALINEQTYVLKDLFDLEDAEQLQTFSPPEPVECSYQKSTPCIKAALPSEKNSGELPNWFSDAIESAYKCVELEGMIRLSKDSRSDFEARMKCHWASIKKDVLPCPQKKSPELDATGLEVIFTEAILFAIQNGERAGADGRDLTRAIKDKNREISETAEKLKDLLTDRENIQTNNNTSVRTQVLSLWDVLGATLKSTHRQKWYECFSREIFPQKHSENEEEMQLDWYADVFERAMGRVDGYNEAPDLCEFLGELARAARSAQVAWDYRFEALGKSQQTGTPNRPALVIQDITDGNQLKHPSVKDLRLTDAAAATLTNILFGFDDEAASAHGMSTTRSRQA